MKLSQLIKHLQDIESLHGDIDAYVVDEECEVYGEPYFALCEKDSKIISVSLVDAETAFAYQGS